MKRTVVWFALLFLLSSIFAGIAYAVAGVPVPPDASGWGADQLFTETVQAFAGAKYMLGVYLAIMLLTQLFSWLTEKVKPAWLPRACIPWVSAALGMISTTVAALCSGVSIYNALVAGLLVGNAASGFWSMLGKRVMTKSAKEDK
jgi:hypothetical protein